MPLSTNASPDTPNVVLPLLDAQLHLAGLLENLLQDEYQALLRSDLAGLDVLVAEKQAAAASLERASLDLAQHTGGAPASLMARLGTEALQRWQRLGDAADRLRQQNLHNGALLNERQNRLRWVAQRAGQEQPAAYAPGPHRLAGAFGGRSLARA